MFPASRSVHRFLLLTCLFATPGSPAMAQEAKSIIALREGKGADAPRVRRVLILHSFGRDFAPFNALSSSFRTALAGQSATPIEFFEAHWNRRCLPKTVRKPSWSITCELGSPIDRRT